MISLETDDDKEEFNISAGKNLSRLFDDDLHTGNEQSKAALFYRPKQNKKPVTETEKSRSSSLQSSTPAKLEAFAASAVDVYKLDQGKYIYVGKLGIALMGPSDPETVNSFRLILYTAKNQPISGATITESFKFVCQADNYCSFYDDAQQNWSIRFSTVDDATRFAVQIAHAQFRILSSKKNPKNPADLRIIQSLTPPPVSSSLSPQPPPPELLTDHMIFFELTVRGFTPGESSLVAKEPVISKQIIELHITSDSPPFLKLLFTKTSLEQSKVVICSPKVALTLNDQLNFSNFWKVELMITLTTVMSFAEWSSEANKKNKKNSKFKDVPVEVSVETNLTETPVPAKRRSNSNTSSSSSSTATAPDSLATRMARMGAQPLFPLISTPLQKEVPTEPKIDSKTESKTEFENSLKPTELSPSLKSELNIPKLNPEETFSLQALPLEHSKSFFEDRFSNIQNSINELKFLIQTSSQKPHPPSFTSSLTMDSALLLNSIQKLITDNETLKTQLAEKSKNYDVLNVKFIELLGQKSTSLTSAEASTDPKISETTFALRNDLLAAREEIALLKGEKYSLSMENLRLEKEVLEGQRSIAELTSRLATASRTFKSSLKQTLNLVYSEFSQQFESRKAELIDKSSGDDDFVLQLLTEVLLSVKRTQEGKVREELKNENSDLKNSSVVEVKQENDEVEKELTS